MNEKIVMAYTQHLQERHAVKGVKYHFAETRFDESHFAESWKST